jgi:hypothetical protein
MDKKIILSQFEDFWKLYPRHVDKGKAKTLWEYICRWNNHEKPTWREIKTAVINQKKSERWQDTKFIPLPTTWLNQQRWLDDPNEMKIFPDKQTTKLRNAYHEPDKWYPC